MPKTAMLPLRASVWTVLPEDDRLKKLLLPDSPSEEIKTARHFLGNLGKANLEDTTVLNKVRECIGILQPHAIGNEQSTLASLLDKANMLPTLQQAAHQSSDEVTQQLTQHANLEEKANQYQEKLHKRREDIATFDEKLAEFEAFKVTIEAKIANLHAQKSQFNECLGKEVSDAEELMTTLNHTRSAVKRTTFQAEDKIIEYQRTMVEIASLDRRL